MLHRGFWCGLYDWVWPQEDKQPESFPDQPIGQMTNGFQIRPATRQGIVPLLSRPTLARWRWLLQALRPGWMTSRQLAGQYEVTTKTIGRDVEQLRNLGVNIDAGSRGLRLVGGTCPCCGHMISPAPDVLGVRAAAPEPFRCTWKHGLGVGP